MSVTQHVLVPTDFSTISIEAIRTANGLALSSTEVTVLHIYNPIAMSGPSTRDISPPPRGLPRDIEFKVMENLKRITQKCLDKPNKVNLEIEVSRFPADAICEYAKENMVDLIILTTHGRTGLSHLLMGSVAEAVVRKATCPVLIARPKAFPRNTEAKFGTTNEKSI